MRNTFIQSFKLRNTYLTNSIIYTLKSLPILKKILPQSLYADKDLKIVANVISGIVQFFSAFLWKAVYLFFVWTQIQITKSAQPESFAHMLIFLTIIGGFLNTQIFNPTRDKFYAIVVMRMDATKYTLVNYYYFLAKTAVGFIVFSLLFGLIAKCSIVTCLVIPVYVICVKLCFTALGLISCKKQEKAKNENKFSTLMWVGIVVLLGLAALPYFGFALPEYTMWILTGIIIVPAVFAYKYIANFDSYRSIYKDLLKPQNFQQDKGAMGAAQQIAMQKTIEIETTQTSNKSGYKYFHELFVKRHAKILTKSMKRMTLYSFAAVVLAILVAVLFPGTKPSLNEFLMNYLPYFLFLMYLINRGRVITQAMFMNCDHSMLAYRFYRQPKAILSLFVERLKLIIGINLVPALVIAIGLPLLLYITGGTSDPLNYVVLFVSIIAMSIFFSVHNIVLYYLLQPYNVNLENKSAAYFIVSFVTYFICYIAIQFQLPTLIFGTVVSAFCIVYSLVAVVLAYTLAPKTFKLRS